MAHTKEPWSVEQCPCPYPQCRSAIINPSVVYHQGVMSREDARRAAVCVNALAGVPTEQLEQWLEEQGTGAVALMLTK